MASSFGLVNTIRVIFKTVGAIQANILINLNSSSGDDGLFRYQNIYIFMGIVCIVTFVLVKLYVRDVILDDAFK
jgi:hypothetical protein